MGRLNYMGFKSGSLLGFLAATGLTLGFTHFWPVGISVLIGLFFWKKWYIRIHPLLIAITSILLIAGIWSDDPMAGVFHFIIANTLFALWHSPVDKREVFQWSFVFLTIGMIAAFFEIWLLADSRPETLLVKDASILGLSGAMFIHPLAGMAGSRTAVAAIWLFAIATMDYRLFLIGILSMLFLFVPTVVRNDPHIQYRFTDAGVVDHINKRNQLNIAPPEIDIPIYGLGYHSYVLETNKQRPHNIFVVSAFELGYLAILFWFLIWLALKNVPLRVTFVLLFVGMFTDELFSRPEGLFMIFGLVLSAYIYTPKITRRGRFSYRIEG